MPTKVWLQDAKKNKIGISLEISSKADDLVHITNISKTKWEPYFVGSMKIINFTFKITPEDTKTGDQMNKNVHVMKYNSALVQLESLRGHLDKE